MDIPAIAAVTFLGLVLGSFATALSYRLPRELSIVTKVRSQCPACLHTLGAADLVPLFSWLFLRGKCRHCKAAIGLRYPLIELATLALCFLFYSAYGLGISTAFLFLLAPVIVALIDIDLHYKIIPDSLNLAVLLTGAGALVIMAVLSGSPASFIISAGGEALAGAVLYGLGSLLLRQGALLAMKREAMGLGDIKFFTAAGFWLGLDLEKAALFMLLSGLSGIVIALAWKNCIGEREVPFGPSLMIAFVAVLCLYPAGFLQLNSYVNPHLPFFQGIHVML